MPAGTAGASGGAPSVPPERWKLRLKAAIRSTYRRPWISASSSGSAATRSQSICAPSETELARSSRGSSACIAHRLRQLPDGTLYRHARGVLASAIHGSRDLFVGEVQLDPEMDELAFHVTQLPEGSLVSLHHLGSDRALQRRGRRVSEMLQRLLAFGTPARPPNLIANAVEHGL